MEMYQELIQEITGKKLSKEAISKLKHQLCKKHGIKSIPNDIQILLHASEEEVKALKPYLQTKPVRTISGVSPIAVMTRPSRCPHGKCTFCPGGIGSPFGDVPQSYTGKEPATMRGIRNHYDGFLQVMNRLEQYTVLGHSAEKVDLIVMGGTFPAEEDAYQDTFVRDCFMGMNVFSELFFIEGVFDFEKFKEFFELPGEVGDPERVRKVHEKLLALKRDSTLEEEKLLNETTAIRCIGLTIETKPDWGFLKHGNRMLLQGCTRVELGIQSPYEDVVKAVHRGHTVEDTKKSLQVLKDLGFKINAHVMPGLPGVDYARDLEGLKQYFSNSSFRPDMMKIYPCMVGPGTWLEQEYKRGNFVPMDTDTAAKIVSEFKPFIPVYCRVQRINRDVPTKQWVAGVGLTNLRQYQEQKFPVKCRCIRCREPRGQEINWDSVEVQVEEYAASGGKEFFLHVEDVSQDLILGFCRLRFPAECLRPEFTPTTAIIRELHINGAAIGIGKEGDVQHKGYGKQLMEQAEQIAKAHGKDKMLVISGVGVKEYYKKLGYVKEGPYMAKGL